MNTSPVFPQAALILCSLSIFSLAATEGHSSYRFLAWLYGISYGGFVYALKMFIYEKVSLLCYFRPQKCVSSTFLT